MRPSEPITQPQAVADAPGTGSPSRFTMRPEIKAAIETRGFEVHGIPAAEFQKIIERDTVKWEKVITAGKIKEKINQEK